MLEGIWAGTHGDVQQEDGIGVSPAELKRSSQVKTKVGGRRLCCKT